MKKTKIKNSNIIRSVSLSKRLKNNSCGGCNKRKRL